VIPLKNPQVWIRNRHRPARRRSRFNAERRQPRQCRTYLRQGCRIHPAGWGRVEGNRRRAAI